MESEGWLVVSFVINTLLVAWILGDRRGRKLAEPIVELTQKLKESAAYLRGLTNARKTVEAPDGQ